MSDLLHDPRIRFLNAPESYRNPKVDTILCLTSLKVIDKWYQSMSFVTSLPTLHYALEGGKSSKYWWLFYGNCDTPLAMDLMHHAIQILNEREGGKYLMWYATVWYDISQSAVTKFPTSWKNAKSSGILNIAHLDAQTQRTLLECAQQLLQEFAIARHISADHISQWMNSQTSLQALLARWPELVWDLLDELPHVQVLIHHAAVNIQGMVEQLQVATFRADPNRIKQVNVHKHINCQLILPEVSK